MNESLHLYLTGSACRLRREQGLAWRRRVTPAGEGEWDGALLDGDGLELAAPGRRWRRRTLHVHLGSALCRFMVAALPQGLRDDTERQAAAAAQMRHQLGLDGAEWTCALDAAAHDRSAPGTIVCAVRLAVMVQLRRLADVNRLALVSVRPFATTVWNAARAGTTDAATLIVVEDDAFTLFVAGSAGLETVSTMGHRRESELIERELRRVALAAGAQGGAVHLAMPAHLDAMAPASAVRGLTRQAHLDREHYADFRDLLFRQAPEDAA
jgi:hypothetical protein